ncbi:hypothetical protein VTN96DRAFT_4024 [Rasamsonia emersonii]
MERCGLVERRLLVESGVSDISLCGGAKTRYERSVVPSDLRPSSHRYRFEGPMKRSTNDLSSLRFDRSASMSSLVAAVLLPPPLSRFGTVHSTVNRIPSMPMAICRGLVLSTPAAGGL